jgi:hypothetical protein
VKDMLKRAAQEVDQELIAPIFQFRNVGVPVQDGWTTQKNCAAFGTDYLTRTAAAKANIFVNMPRETSNFYQDLDSNDERLSGSRRYAVTFDEGELPPVKGFWSLTLYNEHHFFTRTSCIATRSARRTRTSGSRMTDRSLCTCRRGRQRKEYARTGVHRQRAIFRCTCVPSGPRPPC